MFDILESIDTEAPNFVHVPVTWPIDACPVWGNKPSDDPWATAPTTQDDWMLDPDAALNRRG